MISKKKKNYCFYFILFWFFYTSNYAEELSRRAQPAPFDSIFPSTEYLGPTIGVPNTDPIYPLNKFLWTAKPDLKKNDIRVYGWVNPSFNASTSKNSNVPMAYTIVPNQVELDQLVLRTERVPNTVQTQSIDWGFRLTNLYGIDYRYTVAQGYFSNQLLGQNHLYGYDPLEIYGQLFLPNIAQGMVVTLGRYFSPADIETPLAPQSLLITHCSMLTYDTYTQTGINASLKMNNTWALQVGLHSGSDVAPWTNAAHIPSLLALLRWIAPDNNDSLWGGVTSFNNGKFKGNHLNLQQFNLTWSHRFTDNFFTQTETYYIYQIDAALGGTCNFGPIQSFGGGGGGCGPILPGHSYSVGVVNYLAYKFSEKHFFVYRTDFLDDPQGQLTGFATSYLSWTFGITQIFTNLIEIRPEIRYETALRGNVRPYDNGTKANQTSFIIDGIFRF